MNKVIKYEGRCYEMDDKGVIYRDREVGWEEGAEDWTAKIDWERKKLDESLGLEYKVGVEGVVMEVGGYKGEWAGRIEGLYNPRIYIFEPIREYFEGLEERFKGNGKVEVIGAGLGVVDMEMMIGRNGDGSGIFKRELPQEKVKVIDIVRWLREKGIKEVDLMQLNCEGGEYGILRRLILTGTIRTFKNIKVQFHKVTEQSEMDREEIRGLMKETHKESWCYPWVWESWERYDSLG